MGNKLSARRSNHGGSRDREPARQGKGDCEDSSSRAKAYCGIVCIQLEEAKMEFKDRWFACISLGQQTFRTATSSNTDRPAWKSEKKIALEENGARIARISVFETNRLSKNNLVGYCEIDLTDALIPGMGCKNKELELYDPSTKTKIVGTITLRYTTEDRMETEKSFARRLLSMMDEDESGELSLQEFRELMKAFGTKVKTREIESLFLKADTNGDGKVDADELAQLLAEYQEEPDRKSDELSVTPGGAKKKKSILRRQGLMNRCPVCGEKLGQSNSVNDIIHITMCFDEGSGYQTMTGGFLTEKQASYGWMFKLSEWAHLSSYDIGLKEGSNSSHIL
ncbi:hypothetical protein KP509_1Z134400, partial [Ceratopteris richardii]